jgi:heme exporter protein D
MSALTTFFAMGGYALYVWPSYAVFVLVLLADYLAPRLRQRRLLRELQRRQARQSVRPSRATPLPSAVSPLPPEAS